jgi:hypothetical protein
MPQVAAVFSLCVFRLAGVLSAIIFTRPRIRFLNDCRLGCWPDGVIAAIDGEAHRGDEVSGECFDGAGRDVNHMHRKAGGESVRFLARSYGVSPNTISRVR